MNWFPHKIGEGVVIKRLDGIYTAPQNPKWAKFKKKFEVDNLIYGIHEIIREGKRTDNYNYDLCAGPISKEWANAILAKDKKAAIEYKSKWYLALGKSDNTKIKCKIGDILRTAAEDVNKYETDDPRYPYYKTYVAVVMQKVPEKDSPDKPFVLERLSEFTPRRETFVEKGIKDDVKISIEEGKIPKEIYKEYARGNEPFPKEFYNDYREGEVFIQTHIRGLEPEEVEEYKKGKITLAELFEGHSIHIDDRMSFSGLKRLVQWVITDNRVQDYLKMLKGELVETAGGVKNVAKCFSGDTYFPTSKGFRKAQYLKVDDQILGGDGKFHKIEKIFKRRTESSDFLFEVRPFYGYKIILTGNHSVFTKEGWKPVSQIKSPLEICDWEGCRIEVDDYPKSLFVFDDNYSLNEPHYQQLKLDNPKLWQWIGFWLAEGSIQTPYHGGYSISLTQKDGEIKQKYELLTEQLFGKEIGRRKDGKTFSFNSRGFSYFLNKYFISDHFYSQKTNFGRYLKTMPLWIASLSLKCFEAFWKGLNEGDGEKADSRTFSNSSEDLIGRLYLVLLKRGEKPVITWSKTTHKIAWKMIRKPKHKSKQTEIKYVGKASHWGGKWLYDFQISEPHSFYLGNGIICHNSFALVKPSAEEPGMVKKIEGIKEPSISKKGAKILADLQIVKGSYFISPGEVGSTAYKYAWMGLIWRGKVKSGIGRKDYHEYFYYPDENLPEKNKELVKGRYVVKAFKRPKGAGNYWQIWKATEGSPADPIEHKDSGYYVLVPAKDIKAIGRKHYEYGRKEPVGR